MQVPQLQKPCLTISLKIPPYALSLPHKNLQIPFFSLQALGEERLQVRIWSLMADWSLTRFVIGGIFKRAPSEKHFDIASSLFKEPYIGTQVNGTVLQRFHFVVPTISNTPCKTASKLKPLKVRAKELLPLFLWNKPHRQKR